MHFKKRQNLARA